MVKKDIQKLSKEKSLREKTHLQAIEDGSIDKMTLEEVRELIGFYEPTEEIWKLKDSNQSTEIEKWEVVTVEKGCGYTAESQEEAQIISSLEEIKFLLLKLSKENSQKLLSNKEDKKWEQNYLNI